MRLLTEPKRSAQRSKAYISYGQIAFTKWRLFCETLPRINIRIFYINRVKRNLFGAKIAWGHSERNIIENHRLKRFIYYF